MVVPRALRLLRRPCVNVRSSPSARWIHASKSFNCDRCVPPQHENGQASTSRTTIEKPKPLSKTSDQHHDHRDIGKALDLFSVTNYSPGSPLFHPNGSHIFLKLQAFLRAQYAAYGFEEVVSPTIYKKTLWETSGHWENYKDDMFEVSGRGASGKIDGQIGEDEAYGLKPMNCPGHCLIYKSQRRSYRDLPVRYADFSPLHRNEVSGSLSGLTRVRRFHQDDGHIFCTLEQVQGEITSQLHMVEQVYKAFGFEDFKLALSTRPESHYIGGIEEWDRAEEQLKGALEATGRHWDLNPGDGAFYGPKIDIILQDSDGKQHQTATIQLDFQLPQRFDLTYQAPSSGEASKGSDSSVQSISHEPTSNPRPVIVHRAILGSFERFMALLLEHTRGKLPFWLHPRQLLLIATNTESSLSNYALQVKANLAGVDTDQSSQRTTPNKPILVPTSHRTFKVGFNNDTGETLGRQIRAAKRDKWALIGVVGPAEMERGTVALDLSGLEENTRQKLIQWESDLCPRAADDRGKAYDVERKTKIEVSKGHLKGLMEFLEDKYL